MKVKREIVTLVPGNQITKDKQLDDTTLPHMLEQLFYVFVFLGCLFVGIMSWQMMGVGTPGHWFYYFVRIIFVGGIVGALYLGYRYMKYRKNYGMRRLTLNSAPFLKKGYIVDVSHEAWSDAFQLTMVFQHAQYEPVKLQLHTNYQTLQTTQSVRKTLVYDVLELGDLDSLLEDVPEFELIHEVVSLDRLGKEEDKKVLAWVKSF